MKLYIESKQNKDELCHWGVLGMKWGIRRNRRKESDDYESKQEGSSNSKEKYKETVNNNLKSYNKIANESSKISDTTKKFVDGVQVKKQRKDLSQMSDKDLQDAINRELKERQYNDLFAKPSRAEKGKQVVSNILSGAGAALTVTGSALSIALALRELKKVPKL